MRSIKMLDCTLRDGGCVNDFNFGENYMHEILNGLEKARIDIIAMGYIDSEQGSRVGRTKYLNERDIARLLEKKNENITYVAMIDYGKYEPELLEQCSGDSIDGIRLAFHKRDRKEAITWGRKILDRGYKLFMQPMTCLRYSDSELLDLIDDVNSQLPETTAFYIVDSFGEMHSDDVSRLAYLIDNNLKSDIAMGLHAHNNLQFSYSNAVTLLDFSMNRELIFDSSILGMGKGAGNMNTELFAEHLNT